MQSLNAKDIPEGKTLKSYISDIYPLLHQSILLKALQKGDIKVNGARQKKNIVLTEGDSIEVFIPDEELGDESSLEFVFEDENLMIINKKPGISSFDDKNNGAANILSMAEIHMQKNGEYNPRLLNIPYLCHRLDHYTGGLLVLAKNEHSNDALTEAFAERRIRKFYQAVVCGTPEPPAAQLHDFLVKDDAAAKVKITKERVKNSLPVVTRYKTLASAEGLSRLEIELVTGRTHQIRAHMAFYGYPVLGDDKYGNRRINKQYSASYQALWATKLIFELGTGHFMEYLNKQVVETKNIAFPAIVQELGI